MGQVKEFARLDIGCSIPQGGLGFLGDGHCGGLFIGDIFDMNFNAAC